MDASFAASFPALPISLTDARADDNIPSRVPPGSQLASAIRHGETIGTSVRAAALVAHHRGLRCCRYAYDEMSASPESCEFAGVCEASA
jgi:hypothetical protein